MAKPITVTGVPETQRHLHAIAARAGRQRHTMQSEGRAAQRSITGIPVDSGRLARGVRGGSESTLEATNVGYRVGTSVPYARFVFKGTRKMAAQPPRVPRNLGARAASAIAADLRHA
jgi:hypothetical protein